MRLLKCYIKLSAVVTSTDVHWCHKGFPPLHSLHVPHAFFQFHYTFTAVKCASTLEWKPFWNHCSLYTVSSDKVITWPQLWRKIVIRGFRSFVFNAHGRRQTVTPSGKVSEPGTLLKWLRKWHSLLNFRHKQPYIKASGQCTLTGWWSQCSSSSSALNMRH